MIKKYFGLPCHVQLTFFRAVLEHTRMIAKKRLEEGRKTVNEIIYETGYNDVDAFRRVFKKVTDLSPLEYRKKYSF